MNAVLLLALFCAFIGVNSHAVLTVPAAWNPNPSKTSECGGGTATGTPAAQWVRGATETINWHVIAADGEGPVYGYLDPQGGQNFGTGNSPVAINGASGVILTTTTDTTNYPIQITVPSDIECKGGGNNLCTLQLVSSGWYSCATVQICDNCTNEVIEIPHVCVQGDSAGSLNYCSFLDKMDVNITEHTTPAIQDVYSEAAAASYLPNPHVFLNGNDSTCRQLFNTFLCLVNMPPCDGNDGVSHGVCQSMCNTVMQTCDLTPEHSGLYDCSTYPVCTSDDGFSAATSLIASLGLTAFALFFALY